MELDKIKLGTKIAFTQCTKPLVGVVANIISGTTFTMIFKEANLENTDGWTVGSHDINSLFTIPSWFDKETCGGWNVGESDITKIYEQ